MERFGKEALADVTEPAMTAEDFSGLLDAYGGGFSGSERHRKENRYIRYITAILPSMKSYCHGNGNDGVDGPGSVGNVTAG